MDEPIKDQPMPLSITAIAAAVVALSRFIATSNPELVAYLANAVESAEKAGLGPADLQLLKMLVESLA